MKQENNLPKISWIEVTKFLKDYGFIIENAKLYHGLKSTYDYGPLGVWIKEIIKQSWREWFVHKAKNIYFTESAISTKPEVLEGSGHVKKFTDVFIQCSTCGFSTVVGKNQKARATVDVCKKCKKQGSWIEQKKSLLFTTEQGSISGEGQKMFLRPELAQGSFLNLHKIMQSLKLQLPLGLAQIGKAFRNELTTQYGNFRTCEFEQMEIQFFFANEKDKEIYWNYWEEKICTFLDNVLKINPQMYRKHKHQQEELAHYAKATIDFEYQFPFGWKEFCGLANRSQYDLTVHQQKSKTNLTILNKEQKQTIPFVIEPSMGVERLMLILIIDKLDKNKERYTLKLPYQFCYYQVAILPLTEKLTTEAKKVNQQLEKYFRTRFDSKGSIGKRYLWHDAIGTYWCITFDFQSLEDQQVTIRFRDTKKQERIAIKELVDFLNKHCSDE